MNDPASAATCAASQTWAGPSTSRSSPRRCADAARLAADIPDITFVLQHCGMPEDLATEGAHGGWSEGMRRLADQPNVVIEALRPRHLHPPQRPGARRRHRRPQTSALFGAERCLFGSNFPIEKLWTTYGELVDTLVEALSTFPQEDQRQMLATTAERVYRI